MQSFEAYLTDAIEKAADQNLPEHQFANVLNSELKLAAGLPADETWSFNSEMPIH